MDGWLRARKKKKKKKRTKKEKKRNTPTVYRVHVDVCISALLHKYLTTYMHTDRTRWRPVAKQQQCVYVDIYISMHAAVALSSSSLRFAAGDPA